MKVRVLLLAVLCCVASSTAYGDDAASIPLGERLVYDLSWLGIPIGTGELWAKERITLDGREAFHVIGIMRTNKFLSAIYPIRNEIHSWIDADTLTSVKFERFISEGRTTDHSIMEFQEPAQDVISVFYWVRRQPLTPGQSIHVVVMVDKKAWALEVAVLKRQTLDLRGWDPVEALVVEPTGQMEGTSKRRGNSRIHLSDDVAKIPYKITYKAPFGRMVGVLAKNDAITAEPPDAERYGEHRYR